jgi:putative endonuclease
MRVKDVVGRFGEDLAAQRLSAAGMVILDRNWRCRDGEIDIVGRDGECVVFVEVKTRSTSFFGDPAEAVTARKASRLRRLAVRWLEEHRDRIDGWPPMRFDVVSVMRPPAGGVEFAHLKGAL